MPADTPSTPPVPPAPSVALEEFERHRGRLFGLAYRLLGSASDAEDAVQDAFLRWQGADRGAVAAPGAWLSRVVTNLCLTRLTSARARREIYVGPWLPEPVATGGGALGPLDTAVVRESVSFALLVLMERLSPPERAVFVLREAFAYPYRDIADLLSASAASCRQLYHRATARIAAERADAGTGGRVPAGDQDAGPLVARFVAAAADGDLAELERLLAEDVTAWADGGGRVTAARRPVRGRDAVLRYVRGLFRRVGPGVAIRLGEVNAAPALLVTFGGQLAGVTVVEVAGGRIQALRSVLNPAKLDHVRAQLSHSGALVGPVLVSGGGESGAEGGPGGGPGRRGV